MGFVGTFLKNQRLGKTVKSMVSNLLLAGLSHIQSLFNAAEFCYNLQYMELNKRNEGDPWSLRQCGVYQQTCLKTHLCSWILLHISSKMRAKLNQALDHKFYRNDTAAVNSMLPHLIFLSAMAGNWQDYIEYLCSQLTVLVRR